MNKKKCFVIMPFTENEPYPKGHFNKIYEQIFVPAIQEAGYDVRRADENKLSHSIIQDIYKQLTTCEMVVCDLSSGNPNVLYELGIRHSFDLPVVLLKDDITDFIFDVAGIKTIQYSNERLYENVLQTRLDLTAAIKAAEEAKKKGTVLRIMQISKANYSNEAITAEEKNEVLLHQILLEIQKIIPQQNVVERRPKIFYRNKVISQYRYLKEILKREPSIEELQEVLDYPKRVIERYIKEIESIDNYLLESAQNEDDKVNREG